jgi:glycosyltransferase involved in cell wall biosynthesis
MLQAAHLFVLPTRHENFGLAIIEAMACGTPVITTRGTDIWPEIQAAGGIIADSDPAALAAQIIQQLNDPAGRVTRAHRSQDWVFQTLATESLSRQYEKLYSEIKGDADS